MLLRPRGFKNFLLSVLIPLAVASPFGLLSSCEGILTTFNPCGNIFGFCSEADIDLLFASIPDFELDPTCTIPFATGNGCAGGPILPNPGAGLDF